MILIMTRNELNDKAAKLLAFPGEAIEYYPFFDFEQAKNDDMLVLLDLSTDGGVQDLDPEELAKTFVSRGLSKSVRKVLLVMPEISDETQFPTRKSMTDFAKGIEDVLYREYYTTKVHCLNNSTYGSMVIVEPSDKNPKWEIYKLSPHLEQQSLPNNPSSILEVKEKELIDMTPDIRQWMNNEKNPYVYIKSRDPHPALALFSIKQARETTAAKAKADQQLPPSQNAYIEDLSRLTESQRLNALENLANEVEKLDLKLSVSQNRPSSPATPAKQYTWRTE